jgi:hypothetical protein
VDDRDRYHNWQLFARAAFPAMEKPNWDRMRFAQEFAAILKPATIIFPARARTPGDYCGTNGNNLN